MRPSGKQVPPAHSQRPRLGERAGTATTVTGTPLALSGWTTLPLPVVVRLFPYPMVHSLTHTGFFSTPMIASILAIAGLSYYVNYSSSSPSRSPRSGQDPAEESTSIFNFHRMLLPYANAKLWEERRHKLIALESDGAYQRRLFARAERPGIIDNYDTR